MFGRTPQTECICCLSTLKLNQFSTKHLIKDFYSKDFAPHWSLSSYILQPIFLTNNKFIWTANVFFGACANPRLSNHQYIADLSNTLTKFRVHAKPGTYSCLHELLVFSSKSRKLRKFDHFPLSSE